MAAAAVLLLGVGSALAEDAACSSNAAQYNKRVTFYNQCVQRSCPVPNYETCPHTREGLDGKMQYRGFYECMDEMRKVHGACVTDCARRGNASLVCSKAPVCRGGCM